MPLKPFFVLVMFYEIDWTLESQDTNPSWMLLIYMFLIHWDLLGSQKACL